MKSRLDWLEDQLDRDDLPEALKVAYNREADDIANRNTKQQEKNKMTELDRQYKIATISDMVDMGKTDQLVAMYGDEFVGDYDTRKEGEEQVIYSSVAKDDQPSRWVCTSEDEAKAKLRQLLYYRIYDHYYRNRNSF